MIKNVGAALLLAALAAAGCKSAPATPPGFQGTVEYEERTVSFEVSGRIESVPVHRGDVVRAGDVLVKLDDTLARLARDAREDESEAAAAEVALLEAGARHEDVASLAAQAKAAGASEALAKKAAERARALAADQAIPKSELERAEADLSRASFERASLEHKLASLRRGARSEEIARAKARAEASGSALALEQERLARHTLKAAVAGEVLDVLVDPGELATAGAPAVLVADTGHPYVDVFVPQADLAGVHVGSKATVRVDATSGAFSGAVEHVAQQTEFTPRFLFSERERPNLVVRVRVRVDDPKKELHAGVPAFAVIER